MSKTNWQYVMLANKYISNT